MPLRAFVDGNEVIAPFCEDARWQMLKEAVRGKRSAVVLSCCQANGFARTSKLGTKHFVHRRRTECDWQPETAEHLIAKSDIVLACRNAGYAVSTEVSGSDWRADVLATTGRVKVAFEIQWSAQTLEETLERQERYSRDGIRCCWFFHRLPSELEHAARRDVPAFKLSVDRSHRLAVASLRCRALPLLQFVEALLSRRVRFCLTLKSRKEQHVRIVFFEMPCWNCGRPSHVYHVEGPYVSSCGLGVEGTGELWESEKDVFRPEILSMVLGFQKTNDGRHLRIGPIKRRYSKTVGRSYMSFGCPHCDAIFGDYYIMDASLEARCEGLNPVDTCEGIVLVEKPIIAREGHWCYPKDGIFCDV